MTGRITQIGDGHRVHGFDDDEAGTLNLHAGHAWQTRRPSEIHRRRGFKTSVNEMPQRSNENAGRSHRAALARQEGPVMEIAALVLFGSIALWFVEEASGPQRL